MVHDSNSEKRPELPLDEYVAGTRSGDAVILARALTLIESNHPQHQRQAEELLTRLMPHTGQAIRLGITGPPGAGKSTFIEALGMLLVQRGLKVAVLAVDPSSGISGGSILGDKTRMPRLAAEPSAFIRPSPAAGTLGGVARRTRESILVCEAAGFDVVMVETVGAGQSETMVANMTDCFLALLLPSAGDELQGIKRGLLELVDILAVNKADGELRTAAEAAANQYRLALGSLAGRSGADAPAVFVCSALRNEGIQNIWSAIEERHSRMKEAGLLAGRRQQQNQCWLWELVDAQLRNELRTHPKVLAIRDDVVRAVVEGDLPAAAAARQILAAFGLEQDRM